MHCMSKRRVFFSFHYERDYWRVQEVINIGALDGNRPFSAQDWEEIKRQGDEAIKDWIEKQMEGRTCVIVLIGAKTYTRRWVLYEIRRGWERGMGVMGIYIHKLKDQNGMQDVKGFNPFALFSLQDGAGEKNFPFSSVVKAHDPVGSTGKEAHKSIADNIEKWVEEAIEIRKKYGDSKITQVLGPQV